MAVIFFVLIFVLALKASEAQLKANASSGANNQPPRQTPPTYKNFTHVIKSSPARPNPQSTYYSNSDAQYNQNLIYANNNSSATSRILRDLKRTGTVDHDIFSEDDQITALFKAGIIDKEEYYVLKNRLGE